MEYVATLERYSVLHTADLEQFRATVARYLTPHRLAPTRRETRLETDLAMADLGAVTLVYGRNAGAELRVQLTEQVGYYDVNLAFGGTNLLQADRDEVYVDETTAGILSPGMVARMELSDGYRQLHVRVERHALERHLEELLDRPIAAPIRFAPGMDLSRPAAASWAQAVRLLVHDLDQPAGLAAAGRDNPWSRFLMTGLLLAQPHNYRDELAQRQTSPRRSGPVKRAVELIERDPSAELSVERLALEAGTTPRSLQRHFKEYVGCSPREYVQSIRLARAHSDLQAAPPGTTVTDIALKWGFGHVPRFAGAYQARYGVRPSETLKSCR
ncbi:AraC family transcriptional regulator [Amycolatopsis jejuensis]|uniref:AraC family transcriptional regulator n=1 Tax=Amycolatopsis jejuensis TaxID=330084 RepID=UPI000525E8D9|nr:AraC family transcriptional regulator [Amycolatopsis jejuensis]